MVWFSKCLTFFKIPSASLEGQFGDGFSQCAVGLLSFLLHQHDSSGQGTNFFLCILVVLFLLFKSGQSLGELVIGLIKLHLITLDLLAKITDITIVLITFGICFFSFALKLGNGSQKIVSLRLERLHLFPNSIHGYCLKLYLGLLELSHKSRNFLE